MKRYVADFETTTNENDCRVWAYAICSVDNIDDLHIGNSLDDFMTLVKRDNKTIYFHNLKFDGEFIIHWLLTHNFTYSKDKLDNTFNCVISTAGQFYTIEVIYKRYPKGYWHTIFYDSYKKLPFSVDKIAKSFKLDITKLSIDYDEFREINHIITDLESEYIKNDVTIVAQALDIQFKQGLKKMTVGADALSNFKKIIHQNVFEQMFPILDLSIDKDIRQAYRGGFTYVNDKYQNKNIESWVYDLFLV